MRLFSVSGLSLSYFDKIIFKNAALMVQEGDHIGLVGPNGCGKSTFLKILLSEVVPDACVCEKAASLRLGYLDQFADIGAETTVYGYLNAIFADLFALADRADALYAQIPTLDERRQLIAADEAQRLLEQLDARGFYQIEKRIDACLAGLGFSEADREKSVSQLSGGQKTRLVLAKLLLGENDLLILDEPTNFLDVQYIEWLGDYLSRLDCAYIVISHDRRFLNRVSRKIVEIANCVFKTYEGDYDFYLAEKKRREEVQLQQHDAQVKYIARAEAYIAANSEEAMRGIVRTKATWLKKMLATLERIEKPDQVVKPQFAFTPLRCSAPVVLTLRGCSVGYDHCPILPPLSLSVARGEKLVFRGFNGIGKTTLLKSIAGDLPLCDGRIEYGDGVKSVFFRQEEDCSGLTSIFSEQMRRALGIKIRSNRDITVIELMKLYYPDRPKAELHRLLRLCGLNETHFFNRVRTLSGGELTKLRLCVAMATPVNLILLDEPTNHLDPYSVESLIHALAEFDGAVLMTTHDLNIDTGWATREINLEALFE